MVSHARLFSFVGARIILACRDITKAERAAADIQSFSNNKNIYVRILDLSSLNSVKNFCDEFKAKEGRLDILINNAGNVGKVNGKCFLKFVGITFFFRNFYIFL